MAPRVVEKRRSYEATNRYSGVSLFIGGPLKNHLYRFALRRWISLRSIESKERLFEALLKCAPLRSLCFSSFRRFVVSYLLSVQTVFQQHSGDQHDAT